MPPSLLPAAPALARGPPPAAASEERVGSIAALLAAAALRGVCGGRRHGAVASYRLSPNVAANRLSMAVQGFTPNGHDCCNCRPTRRTTASAHVPRAAGARRRRREAAAAATAAAPRARRREARRRRKARGGRCREARRRRLGAVRLLAVRERHAAADRHDGPAAVGDGLLPVPDERRGLPRLPAAEHVEAGRGCSAPWRTHNLE